MPEQIPEGGFEEAVLEAEGPIVVYFTAEWCGPCHRFKPIYEDRAKASDLPFKVVDITDEAHPLWERYEIRKVPTVAIFRDGEIVERVSGFLHDKHLDELLAKVDGGT